MGISEGEKRERNRRSNNWEFFEINDRNQITDPGNSENTKQNKYLPTPLTPNPAKKKSTCKHIIFKLLKIKEKMLKEDRGKYILHIEKLGQELYQTLSQKLCKQEENRVKY